MGREKERGGFGSGKEGWSTSKRNNQARLHYKPRDSFKKWGVVVCRNGSKCGSTLGKE